MGQRMILLNDFARQWEDTRDKALAAFGAVGESGWYVLGQQLRDFEVALAQFWGVRNCVGVASGLDAIEISLRSLGCKPGDKVLTTPLSAFATTLAILKIGAVPIFVDTDNFGLLDLDLCREVLERRPDIRFLLPVHLYGHALDMNRLVLLREQFGCKIVEDCAQSINASFEGTATGHGSDMAATSFYPTKNLGALGDGGAILTNSEELSETARCLRNYGQSAKYHHNAVGYNSRLDELQAALLNRVYLPLVGGWTERRRQVARRYCDGIRNESVSVPGSPTGSHSCWHLFPIYTNPERKLSLITHLRSNGILSAEHYPVAIPDQPALNGKQFEVVGDLRRSRRICQSEISIPIHPYLRDEEVSHVIDKCNRWNP
jgi:dTDP-4-amino-4,6-dideoxygalactose transaminase